MATNKKSRPVPIGRDKAIQQSGAAANLVTKKLDRLPSPVWLKLAALWWSVAAIEFLLNLIVANSVWRTSSLPLGARLLLLGYNLAALSCILLIPIGITYWVSSAGFARASDLWHLGWRRIALIFFVGLGALLYTMSWAKLWQHREISFDFGLHVCFFPSSATFSLDRHGYNRRRCRRYSAPNGGNLSVDS